MLALLIRVDRFLGLEKPEEIPMSLIREVIVPPDNLYPETSGDSDYVDRIAIGLQAHGYFNFSGKPAVQLRAFLPHRSFLDLAAIREVYREWGDTGVNGCVIPQIQGNPYEWVIAHVPNEGCENFSDNGTQWDDAKFTNFFEHVFEYYFEDSNGILCETIEVSPPKSWDYTIEDGLTLRVTKYDLPDGSVSWGVTNAADYVDRIGFFLRRAGFLSNLSGGYNRRRIREALPDRQYLDLDALREVYRIEFDAGTPGSAISPIELSSGHTEPVLAFVPVGVDVFSSGWTDEKFTDFFLKIFSYYFRKILYDDEDVTAGHFSERDTNQGHRCFYFKIPIEHIIFIGVTKVTKAEGVYWTLAQFHRNGRRFLPEHTFD